MVLSIPKLGGKLFPREAGAGSSGRPASGSSPPRTSTASVVIQAAASLGFSAAGVAGVAGAFRPASSRRAPPSAVAGPAGTLARALAKPRARPSMGTACYIPT